MRKKSKLFLINGTILTFTSLLTKLITLVFNIYVTNKIGTEAIGIFSLIMAVYFFFFTIATSGLNVAVTIIVSEKFATNKDKIAIKTIRTCILFSLLLGISSSILIIIFSDLLVKICLHNTVSSKPLFYISASLPFSAMSSCVCSYFNATRRAYKNAIIQVFEFFIKIISTIVLLRLNIEKGIENICLSLILANTISEICSFLLIFIFYIIDINKKKLNKIHSLGQRINILKISIPVAFTAYIKSGLSTIKQLIIPSQLEKSGLSYSNSLSQYGIIDRNGYTCNYFSHRSYLFLLPINNTRILNIFSSKKL